jgi:hypothetical protein
LERIETTRLIGSDLEALQHEIRRLVSQEGITDPAHSLSSAPAQLTSGRSITVGPTVDGWRGGERRGAIVESQPAGDWPRPADWSEPAVVQAEPPHDRSAGSPEPVLEPAAEPPFDRQPAAGLADRQPAPDPLDVFAGLPRLTPLPADVDLIPDSPAASQADRPAPAGGYHGRRRAVDEDEEPQAGGGRRRAPDDAPDDLFARLRQS